MTERVGLRRRHKLHKARTRHRWLMRSIGPKLVPARTRSARGRFFRKIGFPVRYKFFDILSLGKTRAELGLDDSD